MQVLVELAVIFVGCQTTKTQSGFSVVHKFRLNGFTVLVELVVIFVGCQTTKPQSGYTKITSGLTNTAKRYNKNPKFSAKRFSVVHKFRLNGFTVLVELVVIFVGCLSTTPQSGYTKITSGLTDTAKRYNKNPKFSAKTGY